MSLAACIIGLALAAAPPLPPAPADGIRDDARVLASENREALAKDIRAFTAETGILVFLDTNTYLASNTNPGERSRGLMQSWCGDQPGVVICIDRASKPMHAIQFSPALWERSSELEVMPLLQNVSELMGRTQITSESLDQAMHLLMRRLASQTQLSRLRSRIFDHSGKLLAAAFGGCLLLGGLGAVLVTRWLRRYETQQAVQHFFPDVEVGQRFGAPNGGGVVVEISYAASAK